MEIFQKSQTEWGFNWVTYLGGVYSGLGGVLYTGGVLKGFYGIFIYLESKLFF